MSEITVSATTDAVMCSTLHCACFEKGWTPAMMDGVFAVPALKAFVAWRENIPVGMILFTCVAGEAEIVTIGVLPQYRRFGAATLLLDAAFDFVRDQKAEAFFLEVSVDNTPAIGLYLKKGFERTGVRKGYYQTQNGAVDAVTMRAEIR